MNKSAPVLLVPLFLLLGTLLAGAAPGIAPAWYPTGTTFTTNASPAAGGTNLFSVITADINGDGRPDLVSLSFNNTSFPGALTVFTNNGSGFGSNATYTVGSASSVAAADINGDGSVDLVCTITNGTVLVLTNNGAGIFGSNATYTVGFDPVSVAAAATKTNGSVDLIVANYNFGNFPGTLTVLTNNGAGILVSNAAYVVGTSPRSVVAADVNGDGMVDLTTVNAAGSLTVLTNNGSGIFVSSGTFTAGSSVSSVAVADVNGDGRPDLICANQSSFGTLTVMTNAGSGRFLLASTTSSQMGMNLPGFVTVVTNLDGRGLMGVVAANSGVGDSTLTVLTNNGTGVFGSNTTVHAGSLPISIAVADFNGDGRPDLAVADDGTNTLTVLFNSTIFYNTTFTVGNYGSLGVSALGSPVPALTVTNVSLPGGVSFSAPTNTGTATLGGTPIIGSGGVYSLLLTASNVFNGLGTIATQRVAVTINQQPIFQGALLMTNNYLVGNEPYYVAVADVNGDGKPDVISANYNSGSSSGVGGTLTVLTNNGFGGFGSNTSYTVGAGPRCVVVVTNLDGHGLQALVSANYASGFGNTLTVLTNNGSGVFAFNATYSNSISAGTLSVAAADVNGDGYVDLIAANYNNNTLTVFTNNGSGVFKAASTNSVGTQPECVIAADLLSNGKMDLITANYNSGYSGGTLTVLTNNGTGTFTLSSSPSVGQGPESVVAADIYGNGRLALVSGNFGNDGVGSLTVVTNNGKGNFGSNATFQVSSVTSLATADVNCDGKVDLVFAQAGNQAYYSVGVLTNNGSGVFASSSLGFFSSSINNLKSYSIAAADLNGDGRVDLVTGDLYEGAGNILTVLTNVATVQAFALEGSAGPFNTVASGYPTPGFSESGGLPGGVTFNNGILSGAPTDGTVEVTNLVITATNAFGTNTENLTLTVYLGSLVAPPLTINTAENTSLRIPFTTLLAGDSDPNGSYNMNIYNLSSTSTNGGMVQNIGSVAYYTPVTGFAGQDAFTYTLADSLNLTTQGTVYVTVSPRIIPGTDTVSTAQSTALVVPAASLLVNDVDLKGYALTLTAVSATSTNGGTVTLSSGNVTYTPVAGFMGADQFTYTVTDPNSASAHGTIQVIVTAPGSPAYNNMTITPPSGNQLGVAFTGLPNQTYYLQSATNVTGPYADVPPPIAADQNGLVTNSVTMLPGTPAQFYRISSMP